MKHATGIQQGPEARMDLVNMLARELEMSVEQVERIYGEEASKIEANARIRTFIPLLVTSRVRAEFRRLKATT
jgi:hypothetical protein